MNPRIKEMWLAALRSGEYEQGVGVLRSTANVDRPEFCCLGVLCDLHAKETGTSWGTDADGGEAGEDVYYLGYTMFLPPEVMDWADLDTSDPRACPGDDGMTLSSMNDGGASFEEIANRIEEKL